MLPLEGKEIGFDPMKRQYQMHHTVSHCFYTAPVCQVAENSQYRSLLVGEGGNPINMTMGQMWPEESKAIGLDPMKIQYQLSSTSPLSFFAISALHVVENSQATLPAS